MDVSVIVPAYNEQANLERATTETLDRLASFCDSYEVVICDNNSSDRTPDIAVGLAEAHPEVSWVEEPNQGRGLAVAKGFKAAGGDVLAFIDADLATDMSHLAELINSVRNGRYDAATGSRWLGDDTPDRPLVRTASSLGYNFLVRLILGSEFRDHQCGFKSFSSEVIEDVLDDVRAAHWFWDTELLILAADRGYAIREFPVTWEKQDDTAVDLKTDIPVMAKNILALRIRLLRSN